MVEEQSYMPNIIVILISSLLTLDTTIFQIMISRPVISGSVIGYLLGDIKTGLVIGILIELIWIRVIPVGELPPNMTVSTILATYWCLFSSTPNSESILGTTKELHIIMLSILIAVPGGILFKKLEILLRRYNIRLSNIVDTGIKNGKEYIISLVIFLGLVLLLLNSFLYYLMLFPMGVFLINILDKILTEPIKSSLSFSVLILPAIGLAAVVTSFYKKAHSSSTYHK